MSLRMNVVIPMAGRGSRFSNYKDEGGERRFDFPKPLIEFKSIYKEHDIMLRAVIESLSIDGHYVFITRDYHRYKREYDNIFEKRCSQYDIVDIDQVTDGAACTALLSGHLINSDWPVLFVNCDQLMEDWNAEHFLQYVSRPGLSGGMITFKSDNPGASYAKIENGLITEVAEKQLISDNATAGLYYWKHGSDFYRYANQMIKKPETKVNGEYYMCPVYTEAINDGHKFVAYDLSEQNGNVHLIGTPEELFNYEKSIC